MRVWSIVVLALVASLSVSGGVVAQDGNTAGSGDVNCDGSRDQADALAIVKFLAGELSGVPTCPLSDPATQLSVRAADRDGNGVVDLIDALTIVQCWSGAMNDACQSVSSDLGGGGPTADDPIEVTVTVPSAASLVEIQTVAGATEQPGYSMLPRAFDIEAPGAANDVGPITIVFTAHSSSFAARPDATIFRDGVPVEPCAPSDAADSPDPCVLQVTRTRTGDLATTVLSSQASRWTVGVLNASSPAKLGRHHLLTLNAATSVYPECTPSVDGPAAKTRSDAEKTQVDRAIEIFESVDLAAVDATLMGDGYEIYLDYFDCQNFYYEQGPSGVWSRVPSPGYARTFQLDGSGAVFQPDDAPDAQPEGCYIALFQEPGEAGPFTPQTLLHEYVHCHQAFVSRTQIAGSRTQQNWFSEGFAEWFPKHVVATQPSDHVNYSQWHDGSIALANDQTFTRFGGLFTSGYGGSGFWDVYESLLTNSVAGQMSSEDRIKAVRAVVRKYESILANMARLPDFEPLPFIPISSNRSAITADQSAAILAELESSSATKYALLTALASTVEVDRPGHPPSNYPLFNAVPVWPDGERATGSPNWRPDGPDRWDSSASQVVGLYPGEGVFAALGTPPRGFVTEVQLRPDTAKPGLKGALVTATDEILLADLSMPATTEGWIGHEGGPAECLPGSGDDVASLPARAEGTPDFVGVANSSGGYREFEFSWRSGSLADWRAVNCTEAPPAVAGIVNCGAGQQCSNELGLKVVNLLGSADRFEVVIKPGGAHCSPVRYDILLNAEPAASTTFFPYPLEEPGEKKFELWGISRGEHDIAIQATGRIDGCNLGTLQSFGVQIEFPAGLIPLPETIGPRPRTEPDAAD